MMSMVLNTMVLRKIILPTKLETKKWNHINRTRINPISTVVILRRIKPCFNITLYALHKSKFTVK